MCRYYALGHMKHCVPMGYGIYFLKLPSLVTKANIKHVIIQITHFWGKIIFNRRSEWPFEATASARITPIGKEIPGYQENCFYCLL